MNGEEFFDALMDDDDLCTIPVLMLTSVNDDVMENVC